MNTVLKLEELLMLALGVFLFNTLSFEWWWFLVLFLTPDFGMIGYLFGTKIGAVTYNICHHKGIAIILYLLGVYFQNELLQLIGVIVFAHSSFDRLLGYGLKFSDSFKNTHLGIIGKK